MWRINTSCYWVVSRLWIFLLFSRIGFANPIKTILFDVFGTCVEIRNSLIHEGVVWSEQKDFQIDWEPFVDAWIYHHAHTVDLIRAGKLPFMTVDEIHRLGGVELFPKFSNPPKKISPDEISAMVNFWHRLQPWIDTSPGLNRLSSSFQLGTLSNGNESLLMDLAKFGNLPWDIFFSGDKIKKYKPDPKVYEFAEKKLGILPQDILLVASHEYDLQAAKKRGWRTALVVRSEKRGGYWQQTKPSNQFDYTVYSFTELADRLLK